jgi:hypothetical protein
MQKENIKIETISTTSLHINIGVATFLKMFLRGVIDLSFMIKLYGVMNQTAIGQRNGVEMENGDRIIAIRVSTHTAEIISAYNVKKGKEEIGGRVEALARTLERMVNGMFKISLLNDKPSLTAKSISTVRRY